MTDADAHDLWLRMLLDAYGEQEPAPIFSNAGREAVARLSPERRAELRRLYEDLRELFS